MKSFKFVNFFLVKIFFAKFVTCITDFPSLMIANATMVVVIEKPFYERKILSKETSNPTRDAYDKSVATFSSALTKIAREKMKISGLSIIVFQDPGVNLARDYTILLSVASCSTTWELFVRATKEKLVQLAITDSDCPRLPTDSGVSIPLIDLGEELPQIFYDLRIAQGLKWNRANIIHDEVFGQDEIGQMLKAFTNELPQSTLGLASCIVFSIKKARTDAVTKHRIKKVLLNFPVTRPINEHFIIIISYQLIPPVLDAARSLKLLHPGSQWLFVIPDMAEFASNNVTFLLDYLEEGENLAFLYNETDINPSSNQPCQMSAVCYAREMVGSLGIALEKALSKEIELFDRVTEEEFEATGITKLVRSKNIITYMRDELYNDTKSGGRSSICGRCLKWSIVSALTWGNQIGPESDYRDHELKEVGAWTPNPGFEFQDYIFPHAAYGFLGKKLPIATYHNPPWQFEVLPPGHNKNESRSSSSKKSRWDGFVFEIINELSKKLNFTVKLVVVDAPQEIISSKNDTKKSAMSSAEKIPEGVVTLIRNRDVFLSACPFTLGLHRSDTALNFTIPLASLTYGLLTARPKPLSRALLFAMPFSSDAWFCLASSIVLVGPVLFAVHKYSPRQTDQEANNPSKMTLVGLGSPLKCMWYIYGALLQQGGMHLPKTDGARLIVGTWWLVVMVVVATYSGSLVAFLTFPKMEEPVSSIDQLLARRTEFTWSLPTGSFLENYLSVSNNEGVMDYRRLLSEFDSNAEVHDTISYRKNIERVKHGNHALIDWLRSLKISARNEHIEEGICHFSIGTNVLSLEEQLSLAVPANSPYLNVINVQLQRMHESGLMGKWIASWMPTEDECSDGGGTNQEANNHKVDLHDMQGIFFVLFLGYLTATLFLGCEFYRHRRRIAKERKLIRPFLD